MTGGITQKVQADVNAVVGMANILKDELLAVLVARKYGIIAAC